MQEIEGYTINVQNVGNFQWVIQVKTPEVSGQSPVNFITQVKHPAPISETDAYNYFKNKENWCKFFVDLPQ